jgi:hypothetical protein
LLFSINLKELRVKQDLDEIEAIENAIAGVPGPVLELCELQLALVGGGSGEVVMV